MTQMSVLSPACLHQGTGRAGRGKAQQGCQSVIQQGGQSMSLSQKQSSQSAGASLLQVVSPAGLGPGRDCAAAGWLQRRRLDWLVRGKGGLGWAGMD
jgi:hypothetical protein